jgi:hypothetical protein
MEIETDDDLVDAASKGGEITKTQNVAAQTRSLVEQGDRSPVDYEHSGYAALAIRTQFCVSLGRHERSRCGVRRIFRGAFSGALTVLGRCDCGSWSI